VTHATAGDPQGSFDSGATYQDLVDGIHEHYTKSHDTAPSDVKTGASLVSGTTIASNTAWHAGNDGEGSTLDADTIRGYTLMDSGSNVVQMPVYNTISDLPSGAAEGATAYVSNEGSIYVEDGT